MVDKQPSEKTIKSFFKLISLDLVDKVTAELARGLDPNVTLDPHGYGSKTALMSALAGRHLTCARALLDAGADATKRGSNGDGVLHHVEDAAWATELIAKGADVHACDRFKRTALHAAAQTKNVAVATVLLDAGAEVDAKDAHGVTPYASTHSYELRQLLRERGAVPLGKGGHRLDPEKSSAKAQDVDVDRGAIGIDHRGRVWCGGYSGLFAIDGDAISRYVLGGMAFDTIAKGPEGSLYIATNCGLIVVDTDRETFTLYSSTNSDLFDHHLTYLSVAPDGRATMLSYESEAKEKHISVFDGDTFSVLSPGADFPRGLDLECIAFDPNGDLVLGADGALAFKRDGAWVVEKTFGKKEVFPPHVYDVVVRPDAWWIGTQRGVYELRDGNWKLYPTDLASHLCMDADGVLWVGTYFGGLVRIKDGEVAVFKSDSSALVHDHVEGLCLGPDGRVWIRAGREPCFVRNGVIERLTGTKPIPKEEAKAKEVREKKRKLVPFPKKPIFPTAKVPKDVAAALRKPKLAGVTADDLLKLIRPAIAFDIEKQKKIPVGASKFGGKPDLPPDMKWPTYRSDRDRMMPFLLQLDLARASKLDREGLLPKKGMLYFFSDTRPDEIGDLRVLHADSKKLARRDFPEDLVDRKDEEDFIAQVPEYAVKLSPMFTLPSVELLRRRAHLTDDDAEAVGDLHDKLTKLAGKKLPSQCSRFLGWPDSLQDEVTNTEDEIVLLQLNGYELSPKGIHELFDHWCSDGLIHVVIRAGLLAKKRFEKAGGAMAYT